MNLNTGGWASRGLTPLLRIIRSSPNATVPVVVISEPVNSETAALINADIALVAKGTGATLAQVPDGTATGGNKRGIYATDWQKPRSINTYVASGNYSIIAGGQNNTASSTFATVSGGEANTASSARSTIGGGTNNVVASDHSFIGGGQNNVAQNNTHATVCGGTTNQAVGQYSFTGGGISNFSGGYGAFVGGGTSNNATGIYNFVGGGETNAANYPGTNATVCGGANNTASGTYSFIGGGRNNSASGSNSSILGGGYNTANSKYGTVIGSRGVTRSTVGYVAIAAHDDNVFTSSVGTAQGGLLVLAAETTTATPAVLVSDTLSPSSTNQIAPPVKAAYYFKGTIIAARFNSIYAKAWAIEGVIKRPLFSTNDVAFVGTPTVTVIATEPSIPSVAAWAVAVTADTTNQCLSITVTGAASETIRWVAKVETTEVSY